MLRQNHIQKLIPLILYTFLLIILLVFRPHHTVLKQIDPSIGAFKIEHKKALAPSELHEIIVQREVKVQDYFDYLDSIIIAYDSLVPYPLDEHLLVRANDWLIDTLASTDYYLRLNRGEFVYDQKKLTILKRGDILKIPTIEGAIYILGKRHLVSLDLNIPEFKLRIVEAGKVVHTFPVRVGRNEVKYLAMARRKVDLRTNAGSGKIIRIERFPSHYNPVDGKEYIQTKRDDGKYTRIPLIPYIEPEINGQRYGELIHPTTNPSTLGKAYSNGCIGLGEADAWRLYYYAPVGTKVVFRYDLEIINEAGEKIYLKDIYNFNKGLASAIFPQRPFQPELDSGH